MKLQMMRFIPGLPLITKAPDVTSNSAGDLVIQWRSWNPLLDIGEPPIGLYTLEYQVCRFLHTDLLEALKSRESGMDAKMIVSLWNSHTTGQQQYCPSACQLHSDRTILNLYRSLYFARFDL